MDKQILREIGKIYRGLNAFSDFLMASMGLEKGQYQFLIRILETPGINQQQLADTLLVNKTTAAKAINKLVSKGFLVKSTDPNDRRNQQLYLTKKGKQSCEFLQKEELFAVKVTLENTDKKSHAALLDQLNLMSQNVGELYTAFKKGDRNYYLELINKESI